MISKTAILSSCEKYRYRLDRKWGEGACCFFIMLNPSTADADNDDPTIRRCITFAKSWGYGRMIVGNLFAVRATNPTHMKQFSDPVGNDTYDHLKKAADETWHAPYAAKDRGICIAAWGTHGSFMDQGNTVRGWFEAWDVPLHYLKLSRNGAPCHPLYLPGDLVPQAWNP